MPRRRAAGAGCPDNAPRRAAGAGHAGNAPRLGAGAAAHAGPCAELPRPRQRHRPPAARCCGAPHVERPASGPVTSRLGLAIRGPRHSPFSAFAQEWVGRGVLCKSAAGFLRRIAPLKPRSDAPPGGGAFEASLPALPPFGSRFSSFPASEIPAALCFWIPCRALTSFFPAACRDAELQQDSAAFSSTQRPDNPGARRAVFLARSASGTCSAPSQLSGPGIQGCALDLALVCRRISHQSNSPDLPSWRSSL
mmetsp:Transcript_95283/g.258642  ORF Transcript_95283/g.258642 Transcript_95283/m.258642 type:complete len:251 (+) Transcript_95283:1192-1944(+)